jgi:hypothetical protein
MRFHTASVATTTPLNHHHRTATLLAPPSRADRPWLSPSIRGLPLLSEPPAPHPVASHIGLTDEDVPSRSLWSRTRHNCSLSRPLSPRLYVRSLLWVVHVVRSGGMSSDSALPLVGSLRAKPSDVTSIWDLWYPSHSAFPSPSARPCTPQLRHGLDLLAQPYLRYVCAPPDTTVDLRIRLRGTASSVAYRPRPTLVLHRSALTRPSYQS